MPLPEELHKEYEELLNQLSDPELISDWERFEKLNTRKKLLESVIEKEKEINDLEKRVEENKAIMAAGEDRELSSLAEAEISQIQERKEILLSDIKELLSEKKVSVKKGGEQAVIVEIRAGTGGDEASLFAGDLFRMYSRYSQISGWKQKILDSHPSGLGGYKEIVFELSNGNVFAQMRYEAGVHRVQRIPITEKNGRIHTSTASVAILLKPKKTELIMKPDELKIDFFRSSGPGGQNVNKRETAVRITHLPTGIVVASQTERNQLQNKENALAILSARVLEKKEEEEFNKVGGKRNEQIGQAKRVEKIRTYNFPQNRVTDHRIKKSFHDLESIIAGKLEPVIQALQEAE
ncbi:MAG: peptide chain release factor 1 [bacterium]|nr:peptide chain release factor 1 [bacterium]